MKSELLSVIATLSFLLLTTSWLFVGPIYGKYLLSKCWRGKESIKQISRDKKWERILKPGHRNRLIRIRHFKTNMHEGRNPKVNYNLYNKRTMGIRLPHIWRKCFHRASLSWIIRQVTPCETTCALSCNRSVESWARISEAQVVPIFLPNVFIIWNPRQHLRQKGKDILSIRVWQTRWKSS